MYDSGLSKITVVVGVDENVQHNIYYDGNSSTWKSKYCDES